MAIRRSWSTMRKGCLVRQPFLSSRITEPAESSQAEVNGCTSADRQLSSRLREASPLDREMPHHSLLVMLEDVAVVHPLPRPIVRDPRNSHTPFGRHVDRVLP